MVKKTVVKVALGARDGWLILGIVFAMLVALEYGYRAQGAIRRALRGEAAEASVQIAQPYGGESWWSEFLAERLELKFRWEPYSYSRTQPYSGTYINIGERGLRVTPHPDAAPDSEELKVFFMGGSTTWGFGDRDANTRPAVVAQRLAEAGFDPDVTNFGQLGFVGSQELVTLLFELHSGNIPDVVVFWDGVNDLNSARRHGVPGMSYSESEREAGTNMAFEMQSNDGNVSGSLALRSILSRSEIFGRIRQAVIKPAAVVDPPDPVPFCAGVMGHWLKQARVIDRLADAYGFVALSVWQPSWPTSNRPQSDFEKSIAGEITIYPQDRGLADHYRECARVGDSLVAAGAARSIRSWADFHASDPQTVFIDEYGHTTERATAAEADSLSRVILGLVRQR